MTDCRILVGSGSASDRWQFSGGGFLEVPGRVVTASHVVRDRDADQVVVEVGGERLAVCEIVADAGLDVAVLRLEGDGRSAPTSRVIAVSAGPGTEWIVTTRPQSNDPQLGGVVAAVGRTIVNQGGHEVAVLQLLVTETVQDYRGYSGSAVRLASRPDAVLGVLCEQVKTRLATPGVSTLPATNVLYAVPIREVANRFGLELSFVESDFDRRVSRVKELVRLGDYDGAESEIRHLPRTGMDSATPWYLRSMISVARNNPDVARQYLYRALREDPRHMSSIAALIRVLLVLNGDAERDEARRLAAAGRGVGAPLDGWLECMAANGMFEPGIRSDTEVDECCPFEGDG